MATSPGRSGRLGASRPHDVSVSRWYIELSSLRARRHRMCFVSSSPGGAARIRVVSQRWKRTVGPLLLGAAVGCGSNDAVIITSAPPPEGSASPEPEHPMPTRGNEPPALSPDLGQPAPGVGGPDPGVDGPDPTAPEDSTPPPPVDRAAQPIDSSGGELVADGIRIAIPSGALDAETWLATGVTGDAVVTVTPDVYFASPATVRMDGVRWPRGGDRIALHLTEGEWYMMEPVTSNDDGSWQYETMEFSSTAAPVVNVVTEDLDAWDVYDVWEDVAEVTRTIIPERVTALDVTKCCLADASADIGSLHDPVSPAQSVAGRERKPRDSDEYAWMTQEAATALALAREALKAAHPEYDIWVNGAWDSSGSRHSRRSLHYFGVALDLGVARNGVKLRPPPAEVLGLIPPLLVNAGFTWVFFEDANHIHASISSPSLNDCVGSIDINGLYSATPAALGTSPNCPATQDTCFCTFEGAKCPGDPETGTTGRDTSLLVDGSATRPSVSYSQCAASMSIVVDCRRGDTLTGITLNTFGFESGRRFTATFSPTGVTGSFDNAGMCGDDVNAISFYMPKLPAN